MAAHDYNYALTVFDNIQAKIVANINTELAAINASAEPVIGFTTPLVVALNFPSLYLDWRSSGLKKSDDDSFCGEQHEFLIGIAVTGRDHDTLTKLVMQYAVALNRVIDKMTANDLITGVTNVLGAPVWEITDHDPVSGLRTNDAGIYRRDVYLTMIVQIIETRGHE